MSITKIRKTVNIFYVDTYILNTVHFYTIWTLFISNNYEILIYTFQTAFFKIISNLQKIFHFVKQMCIKNTQVMVYTENPRFTLKYCTRSVVFKRIWKLTLEARNANFSKMIVNISAKILIISRI